MLKDEYRGSIHCAPSSATRTRWLVFTLSAMLLASALLLNGNPLAEEAPSVQAAGRNTSNSTSDCTKKHYTPSLGGNIVIAQNTVLCSPLIVFGGTLALDGTVKGSVMTFGTKVTIQGEVDGNIYVFGGTIALGDGSQIVGNIHTYGTTPVKPNDAHVKGSIYDAEKDISRGWLFGSNTGFNFPFLPIFTWVALGLVFTTLFPENVMFVRTTVVNKPRRSFFLGLLSVLLAPLVLVVLVALIVSIPLAFIIALGLIAAWALGTVAIGWYIGHYIMQKVAPNQSTRPLQVAIGLIVLVILGSLPYIGWLISIGVGLIGLGAVFLSRFGTRLYSLPKSPLTE